MMLSGPSAARDAKDHEGLLIMVKGRSKPIRPTNVTLFVLLSLIYVYQRICCVFEGNAVDNVDYCDRCGC